MEVRGRTGTEQVAFPVSGGSCYHTLVDMHIFPILARVSGVGAGVRS